MLAPRLGVTLPAVVGGFLFWAPVVLVGGEAAREAGAAPLLLHGALLPAWCALLWWTFVARSPSRAQRIGVPLGALLVAWLVGPLLLGSGAPMVLSPVATFMFAAYSGALLGLGLATVVLIGLGSWGLRASRGGAMPREEGSP